MDFEPLHSGVDHFDIKHCHLTAHYLDHFSLEAGNSLLEQTNVANTVCSPSISLIWKSVLTKYKSTIKSEGQ